MSHSVDGANKRSNRTTELVIPICRWVDGLRKVPSSSFFVRGAMVGRAELVIATLALLWHEGCIILKALAFLVPPEPCLGCGAEWRLGSHVCCTIVIALPFLHCNYLGNSY